MRVGVFENGRYRLENADEIDKRLTSEVALYRSALQKQQDVEDHMLECLYCLHDDECNDRQRLVADAGVARVDTLARQQPTGEGEDDE